MSVLRTTTDNRKIFWCPGCDSPHSVRVNRVEHPVWEWNGSDDKPTFNPSILVTWRWSKTETDMQDEICHSWVRDGMIQFLGDCTHGLANQTVPLPEWPYKPGEYGGLTE